MKHRIIFIAVTLFIAMICGRVGWLAKTDQMQFESSLESLFPRAKHQGFEQEIERRLSTDIEGHIVILIVGQDVQHAMHVTDVLSENIETEIESGKIEGEIVYGADQDKISSRVAAMSRYRDRLISDKTAFTLAQSPIDQIQRRKEQAEEFPPSNFTSLTLDPLGTVEDFLSERMPKFRGVVHDGLYFRLDSETPGILLIVELASRSLGAESANKSTDSILKHVRFIEENENADIYISGFPVYATEIRNNTVGEIVWMSVLAVSFTMFYFLFVTRSLLALVSSIAMILIAIAGAISLSQISLGLPHLIGLTMATTAIGICIDFSFHFWVYVKSGLSGAQTIKSIRGGLNMGFITTSVALVSISFISVPVLARSAVFMLGALFTSWIFVLVVLPRLANKARGTGYSKENFTSIKKYKLSSLVCLCTIVLMATFFLGKDYYVDDNPIRLGQKMERLADQEREIKNQLGTHSLSAIFLINENTPDSLLSTEVALIEDLSFDERSNVMATSRLVPASKQQLDNREMYLRSLNQIDPNELAEYLDFLNISDLDFHKYETGSYNLNWVLAQEWADVERGLMLDCGPSQCSSMVKANGVVVEKLQRACENLSSCKEVSFATMKQDAFSTLRASLSWALIIAIISMFLMLYVRYRVDAIKLILVPILACLSGVAMVSALEMPITTFTLAALFPLLGLSIDYAVFVKESSKKMPLTLKAVFASAVTTTVSFFILAFSSTPAVQFFAIPIAAGIPVAWLFVQTSWFKHDRQFS